MKELLISYLNLAQKNWFKMNHNLNLNWNIKVDYPEYTIEERFNKKKIKTNSYSLSFIFSIDQWNSINECFYSVNDIINSKEFLESIQKALLETNYINTQSHHKLDLEQLMIDQSIALFNNEYEKFIKNILLFCK